MLKFLLFFVISINLFAYTSVSPLYFDERIDGEGGYKEYTLSNATRKIVGYKIYFEKKNEKNDMTKWVDYYPKKLTLNPGESKKVKILITSPKDAKNGEYITNFCIKEIETPSEKGGRINLLTNLKIELAGYVGNIPTKLSIDNLKLVNGRLNLDITNVGRKREWIELYLVKGKKSFYLESIRLFKSDKKHIEKNIEKNLGENLKLIAKDRKGKIIFEKTIN